MPLRSRRPLLRTNRDSKNRRGLWPAPQFGLATKTGLNRKKLRERSELAYQFNASHATRLLPNPAASTGSLN